MKKLVKVEDIYRAIPPDAKILDVGCLGYNQLKLSQKLGFMRHKHFGVDYIVPNNIPKGFVFRHANLNKEKIPFNNDSFDLVIANHIIEHLTDPLSFFQELVRVCKPGGYIYLETPSERSLLLPGMPFNYDGFRSLSFYDDPTHISRPWSPQSLHRLAKYYGCNVISSRYMTSLAVRLVFPFLFAYSIIARDEIILEHSVWNAIGWCSSLVAQKPEKLRGAPDFTYYFPNRKSSSLKIGNLLINFCLEPRHQQARGKSPKSGKINKERLFLPP